MLRGRLALPGGPLFNDSLMAFAMSTSWNIGAVSCFFRDGVIVRFNPCSSIVAAAVPLVFNELARESQEPQPSNHKGCFVGGFRC